MQTATDLELGIKPWPKSLTMVAPFTHGKTLLYIKPSHQGAAHFGYSAENLTQLYGADSGSLVSRLGSNWVDLSTEDVKDRLTKFASLMKDLQRPEEAAPVPST